MRVHRPHAIRVLLLLSALVSFLLGDRGMVLCIAPDGHVAIEVDREGSCAPSASHHDPEAIVPADSCCGPCADVPLPSSTLAAGGSRHDAHASDSKAPLVASHGCGRADDRPLRAFGRADALAPRAFIPTGLYVVLRC